jgi:MSHA biogenesis protein MshM
MRHWGLERDPFAGPESPYVPLPSHEEAVARLVHTIETSQRRVIFTGAAGLGKTIVLQRAISETLSPRRRFATVSCTGEGPLLLAQIVERLGARIDREPSRLGVWRSLERALRVSSLLGFQIVLAIDDCSRLTTNAARRDLDSLVHLGATASADLTIIQLERAEGHHESQTSGSWILAITLKPLTRSQAESYLTAKLARAGCTERIFTSRAVTRLHALSGGVPRKLQELAMLCLLAGAARGLEVVPPDLVDGVAEECGSETRGAEIRA